VKVDAKLADLTLKDSEDRPVLLGSLWQDRPAALVFVRHFG